MDKRTAEKLSKVGRSIPLDMLKAAVRREKSESTESAMYSLAKSGKLGEQKSKEIMRALDQGAFAGKETLKVDEGGNKEINEFLEAKVKGMIDKGEIKKAEPDSFMKKIQEKFRK